MNLPTAQLVADMRRQSAKAGERASGYRMAGESALATAFQRASNSLMIAAFDLDHAERCEAAHKPK